MSSKVANILKEREFKAQLEEISKNKDEVKLVELENEIDASPLSPHDIKLLKRRVEDLKQKIRNESLKGAVNDLLFGNHTKNSNVTNCDNNEARTLTQLNDDKPVDDVLKDFEYSDEKKQVRVVKDAFGGGRLQDCRDCLYFVPNIQTSILAYRLTNCIIITRSRQARFHDLNNCLLVLDCQTNPIIEGCSNLYLAPFFQSNGDVSFWNDVIDFDDDDDMERKIREASKEESERVREWIESSEWNCIIDWHLSRVK